MTLLLPSSTEAKVLCGFLRVPVIQLASETPTRLYKAVAKIFEDYRNILNFEFEQRNRRNPAYSMRAFARDLGLSSSRLSEILSGKQGLSPERSKVIGSKIGYTGKKLSWFQDLVAQETARSQAAKTLAKRRSRRFRNGVKTERAKLPKSIDFTWYHLAIRRMTSLSDFQSNSKWISNTLGITEAQATQAIDDLLHLKLIQRNRNGILHIDENIELDPSTVSPTSLVKVYEEMMSKALSARTLPREERRFGLHMFTIDREQTEELHQLIQDFEDKLDDLTYRAKYSDDLIAVTLAAFPMIRNDRNSS